MAEVDVFDRRRELELSTSQATGQGAVFFPDPLLVDQQAKPFFKAEAGDLGVFLLLAEGVRHAVELHRVELFQSLLR